MTPHECLPVDRLEELLRIDPTDPRRTELESCPRCQARLLLFQRFLEPGSPPPAADLAKARVRLREALAQERILRETGRSRRRFLDLPTWLGWRPALAFATTLAVFAVLLVLSKDPSSRRFAADALRGTERLPAGATVPLTVRVFPPRTGPDGSVVLRWTRVPRADSYVLVFHTLELTEILRLPAVSDTFLSVPASILTRLGEPGQSALASVSARLAGDEIVTSPPAVVRIP